MAWTRSATRERALKRYSVPFLALTVAGALMLTEPLLAQLSPVPGVSPPIALEHTQQEMLAELRHLRKSLESGQTLTPRILLVGQQLHAQETRLGSVSRQLDTVRLRLAEAAATRAEQAGFLASLERDLTAEESDSSRRALEREASRARARLKGVEALEQHLQRREGELTPQLERAQAEVTKLSERLAAFERRLAAPPSGAASQ